MGFTDLATKILNYELDSLTGKINLISTVLLLGIVGFEGVKIIWSESSISLKILSGSIYDLTLVAVLILASMVLAGYFYSGK